MGKISEEEKNIIIQMRSDNKSYREIAKELNCKMERVKRYCQNNGLGGFKSDKFSYNTEESIIDRINKNYPKYEYAGGYTGSDGQLLLKCKCCGDVFKYNAQITRPSRNRTVVCSNCIKIKNEIAAEQKKIEKRKQIEKLEYIKKEKRIKELTAVCNECGKVFIGTSKGMKYCSKECLQRYHYRKKSIKKRRKVKENGKIDHSITLNKLIKRDKNVCHICGGVCDNNDYKIINNSFIAGGNYPSIDHLTPVSKGGTHTWDNVKLAHCLCNSIKSDNMFYEEGNGQLTIAI